MAVYGSHFFVYLHYKTLKKEQKMQATIKHKDVEIKIVFSTRALINTLNKEKISLSQIADTTDGGIKMSNFVFSYIETALSRAGLNDKEITEVIDEFSPEDQADFFALAVKSMENLGSVFSKVAEVSQRTDAAK
jgi:hypothetical protein